MTLIQALRPTRRKLLLSSLPWLFTVMYNEVLTAVIGTILLPLFLFPGVLFSMFFGYLTVSQIATEPFHSLFEKLGLWEKYSFVFPTAPNALGITIIAIIYSALIYSVYSFVSWAISQNKRIPTLMGLFFFLTGPPLILANQPMPTWHSGELLRSIHNVSSLIITPTIIFLPFWVIRKKLEKRSLPWFFVSGLVAILLLAIYNQIVLTFY